MQQRDLARELPPHTPPNTPAEAVRVLSSSTRSLLLAQRDARHQCAPRKYVPLCCGRSAQWQQRRRACRDAAPRGGASRRTSPPSSARRATSVDSVAINRRSAPPRRRGRAPHAFEQFHAPSRRRCPRVHILDITNTGRSARRAPSRSSRSPGARSSSSASGSCRSSGPWSRSKLETRRRRSSDVGVARRFLWHAGSRRTPAM